MTTIQWDDVTDAGVEMVRRGPNSFAARYHFRDACSCGQRHGTAPRQKSAAAVAPAPRQVAIAPPRFSYIEQHSVEPGLVAIAQSSAQLAVRELGLRQIEVRWFGGTSAAVPQDEVVTSSDIELDGFTFKGEARIWLRSDLAPARVVGVVAHELSHVRTLALGMTDEDSEAKAQAYESSFASRYSARR